MPLHLLPPRAPGFRARAYDLLLGFALGAAVVYLLDRALAARDRGERDDPVEDGALLGRVHLALAQTIADPRAVDVRVHDGTVVLRGPATGEQIAEMVACAHRVRGVRRVENRLSPTG